MAVDQHFTLSGQETANFLSNTYYNMNNFES